MTDDPIGEGIPELITELEGSLDAPDAASVHAGLSQRRAARKRTIGVAGVFVAVLAIGGGAFALTRDDTTETVTADDAIEAVDAVDDAAAANGTVADDSTPMEIGAPRVSGNSSTADSATVVIAECANDSSITLEGELWVPWNLPAAWEGQGRVDVTVVIGGEDSLKATDDAGNSALFVLVEGRHRELSCRGFTLDNTAVPVVTPPPAETTTSTSPAQTTATTTAQAETTTTAAPPPGPPAFAPSADVALSGQWEPVRLWSAGKPVDITGFGGSIGKSGAESQRQRWLQQSRQRSVLRN